MHHKRLLKYSLRLFFWLILPLICAEVLIILDPFFFKGFVQYDPDLGYRVRAYYPGKDGNLTNQFGFNDQDYPLQKTPGVYRVLVVGDSYNWAGGRDGNYTSLLERKLENHYGAHKVDVINVGYPGTHSGEQLEMLKKYGLQYHPDLVILGFFAGNDFFDADPYRKRIVINDLYVDIDKRKERRILGFPILLRSRLLLFLQQKYRIRKETAAQKTASGSAVSSGQPARVGTFTEETFLSIEKARLEFFNEKTSAGRFQKNIDYALQCVSEMNQLLQSRNTKFMVAIYPGEIQVSQNLFDSVVASFKLNGADYNLNRPEELLKTFLQAKGIEYVDMLEPFRSENRKQEVYLFRDTHWNKAGNELAADILFEYLIKHPNPPDAPPQENSKIQVQKISNAFRVKLPFDQPCLVRSFPTPLRGLKRCVHLPLS
jgi:hypothetical protein